MKTTHLFWPATSVFEELKMWRSQHELEKRFTGLRAIFNAGSISPRSVANKVYIHTHSIKQIFILAIHAVKK